jgi:hypothetical protein
MSVGILMRWRDHATIVIRDWWLVLGKADEESAPAIDPLPAILPKFEPGATP